MNTTKLDNDFKLRLRNLELAEKTGLWDTNMLDEMPIDIQKSLPKLPLPKGNNCLKKTDF